MGNIGMGLVKLALTMAIRQVLHQAAVAVAPVMVAPQIQFQDSPVSRQMHILPLMEFYLSRHSLRFQWQGEAETQLNPPIRRNRYCLKKKGNAQRDLQNPRQIKNHRGVLPAQRNQRKRQENL